MLLCEFEFFDSEAAPIAVRSTAPDADFICIDLLKEGVLRKATYTKSFYLLTSLAPTSSLYLLSSTK